MVKISEIQHIGLGDIDVTDVILGTDSLSSAATRNFSLANLVIFLNQNNLNGLPASSVSDGYPGTFAVNANFLYVCTAVNTWRRVAVTAF